MNIPSVEEYKDALLIVLGLSPDTHQKMLKAHYKAKNYKITATELAQAAGYKNFNAANLQYGKFSAKLCKELIFRPPIGNSGSPTPTYVLATPKKTSGSDWEWTLRPEVIKAINELKLFDSEDGLKIITEKKKEKDKGFLNEKEFDFKLQKLVAESQQLTKRTRELKLSIAQKKPSKISVLRTEFQRNPDVIAEVLLRADGICEFCGQSAPFCRASDGSPYLEVHHVIPLAKNGEDTVENAMALCPNCHRKMHYGN